MSNRLILQNKITLVLSTQHRTHNSVLCVIPEFEKEYCNMMYACVFPANVGGETGVHDSDMKSN